MTRTSKILIGILSLLPILVTAVLFIRIFIDFVNNWENSGRSLVSRNFYSFFYIGLGLSLLSIALLIYFIIHAGKNKKMDSTERAIWILVFVLGGPIGYPIYWYMKIWKEDI